MKCIFSLCAELDKYQGSCYLSVTVLTLIIIIFFVQFICHLRKYLKSQRRHYPSFFSYTITKIKETVGSTVHYYLSNHNIIRLISYLIFGFGSFFAPSLALAFASLIQYNKQYYSQTSCEISLVIFVNLFYATYETTVIFLLIMIGAKNELIERKIKSLNLHSVDLIIQPEERPEFAKYSVARALILFVLIFLGRITCSLVFPGFVFGVSLPFIAYQITIGIFIFALTLQRLKFLRSDSRVIGITRLLLKYQNIKENYANYARSSSSECVVILQKPDHRTHDDIKKEIQDGMKLNEAIFKQRLAILRNEETVIIPINIKDNNMVIRIFLLVTIISNLAVVIISFVELVMGSFAQNWESFPIYLEILENIQDGLLMILIPICGIFVVKSQYLFGHETFDKSIQNESSVDSSVEDLSRPLKLAKGGDVINLWDEGESQGMLSMTKYYKDSLSS